jgi:hypothetical protein
MTRRIVHHSFFLPNFLRFLAGDRWTSSGSLSWDSPFLFLFDLRTDEALGVFVVD